MQKTLDNLKIVSSDEEIIKLAEEATYYLLSVDKSIAALTDEEQKEGLYEMLSETVMEFVIEKHWKNTVKQS